MSGKPLKRVSANDALVLREVLRTLAALGEPPEQTQRRLFLKLTPILYALRKRLGYTFKQLTRECNSCGLMLTESTVRVYYSQFAPQMQKECQRVLEEMDLIACQVEVKAKQLSLDSTLSRSEILDGFIKAND